MEVIVRVSIVSMIDSLSGRFRGHWSMILISWLLCLYIRKTRFRLFFFPRNHFQRRPPYLSPLSSFRPRKAHPIWQLIARMRSTETGQTEMGNSKMGNTERKNTEMENTRKNAAPAIADGCTLRALFKIFVHRQIGQMHFSIRSTQPCSDNCDNHEDAVKFLCCR